MARRKERPARWLEYMRLDEIGRNPDNAKTHDMEMVGASAERFGIIDILTLDERTGWLVAGHGRLAALERQAAALEPPPEGIEVADDGTWMVPV
ncbi:MAG: hypothetical protein ACRDXE_08235, partial [Acidimicrobiales bacterium]